MLSLMVPAEGLGDYSRAEFLDDVVAGCAEDIRRCFAAGASRVSIDFTEGRLALREDLRAPWAGPEALGGFIELINRVLAELAHELRAAVGVHTCPGNDNDSAHSADVDYAELIPELFQIGKLLSGAVRERGPRRGGSPRRAAAAASRTLGRAFGASRTAGGDESDEPEARDRRRDS